MADVVTFVLQFVRNIVHILWYGRRPIRNTLDVFVKSSSGDSLSLNLNPKWDIKNVKEHIAAKFGAHPEEMKIILAGKELDDEIVIENCDLGQQSTLHVVKCRSTMVSTTTARKRLPKRTISSINENVANTFFKSPGIKYEFYIYCNSPCQKLAHGKLRVRCSTCKGGTITVDADPSSWNDVLLPQRISGYCHQDNCTAGPVAWAEFYFKCAEHISKGEDDTAVPLNLLKDNVRKVVCLACMDIKDMVLVFPCKEAHVTCIECFQQYASSRLRERQFILHEKIGYTLSCPAGCDNSFIEECQHFKLLTSDQYETYQRFATEELVLKSGGVLCPYPDCGSAIMLDEKCDTVVCEDSCGYVFCRHCLQGYHMGECEEQDEDKSSTKSGYHVDAARAAQGCGDKFCDPCHFIFHMYR